MNIDHFAAHFLAVINSMRGPASVGLLIIREFYLSDLSKAGISRAQATKLTDEELSELWQELPEPKAFAPLPMPYAVALCYSGIRTGIVQYTSVSVIARQEELFILNHEGQVVHKIDGSEFRNLLQPGLQHALRFIGMADEVLRPYISRFQWDEESALLELALTDEQIDYLQASMSEKDS